MAGFVKGKANVKFRRPKLTLEQKSLRTVFKTIGNPLKDEVRRAMPRITGALYFSIAFKVSSLRQNDVFCVLGSKVRYGKNIKGHRQIIVPNRYVKKVEEKHHVLARYTGSKMLALITQETQAEMKKAELV